MAAETHTVRIFHRQVDQHYTLEVPGDRYILQAAEEMGSNCHFPAATVLAPPVQCASNRGNCTTGSNGIIQRLKKAGIRPVVR